MRYTFVFDTQHTKVHEVDTLITDLTAIGVGTGDIATICGVTQRTVQNWQSGKHRIPEAARTVLEGELALRQRTALDEILSQINDIRRKIDFIETSIMNMKKLRFMG